MPELPEVETIRTGLEPHLVGRTFEHVEISDPRLTRPHDPLRGRRRARRGDRGRGRAPRQVSGCSVRDGSGSPDSPPDDGKPAARPAWSRGRRPLRQGCRQIRQRIGRRVSRRPALRHLAPPRARRARAVPRGAGRQGAARQQPHRPVAGRPPGAPQGAAQGRRPRPARLRRRREHLRGRGALVGAAPSAASRRTRSRRRSSRPWCGGFGGPSGSGSPARERRSATTATRTARREPCRREFRVYGRAGEACTRCGHPIEKTRAGGRGTWFCPNCQL